MAVQDGRQVVEGQGGREVVGLAAHVVGNAQEIDDGFLGSFHHGFVQAVAGVVEQDLDLVGHA